MISCIQSIVNNYSSWITMLGCIYWISPKGLFTFFVAMITSYGLHYYSHRYHNIITCIHTYHHTYHTWASIFMQLIYELAIMCITISILLFFSIDLDIWIILFYTLFYSILHHINYGHYKFTNVHKLHHKHLMTNLGPDICDIFFGTKNKKNKKVEDTSHYIPSILISCIIIVILQWFWNHGYKYSMSLLGKTSMYSIIAIYMAISIYLWKK